MLFYGWLYVLDHENLTNVIESLLDTVEENAASNDTSITSNFTEEIQSTLNNYCQEMSSTENDFYHFKLFELWLFEILLSLNRLIIYKLDKNRNWYCNERQNMQQCQIWYKNWSVYWSNIKVIKLSMYVISINFRCGLCRSLIRV